MAEAKMFTTFYYFSLYVKVKNNAKSASNVHSSQLSQPQQQHNVTQPQHSCWVGHENYFANPTTTTTTETQQQPL